MSVVVDGLFIFLWVSIGFSIIFYVASRFREKIHPSLISIAIVLSFVLGYRWPYAFHYENGPPSLASTESPSSLPASAPSNDPINVINSEFRVIADPDYNGSIDNVSLDSKDLSKSVSDAPAGATVYLSGWVANTKAMKLANGLVIIVDNSQFFNRSSSLGGSRPDLKDPRIIRSGFFSVPLSTNRLKRGTHVIQAAALSTNGRDVYPVSQPKSLSVL